MPLCLETNLAEVHLGNARQHVVEEWIRACQAVDCAGQESSLSMRWKDCAKEARLTETESRARARKEIWEFFEEDSKVCVVNFERDQRQ